MCASGITRMACKNVRLVWRIIQHPSDSFERERERGGGREGEWEGEREGVDTETRESV